MAENEPLSPEKQLLKLIENPKQEQIKLEGTKREGKKLFSLGALKGRFAFWKTFSVKRWFSVKQVAQTSFGIGQINLALQFIVIVAGIYFAYAAIQMGTNLKRASNLILEPDKNVSPGKSVFLELRNLSYYLEKIAGRNIFSVYQVPTQQPKRVIEAPAEEENRSKDFSLVGISWSANPEAMIEDVKNKRTHFVKRGQVLDGSVRIVTILKDKVILSDNDTEFELK